MAEIAQLRRDLESLGSVVSGIRAELPVGGVKDLVDQIKMTKTEAAKFQADTSAKLAELAGKVDVLMKVIKTKDGETNLLKTK